MSSRLRNTVISSLLHPRALSPATRNEDLFRRLSAPSYIPAAVVLILWRSPDLNHRLRNEPTEKTPTNNSRLFFPVFPLGDNVEESKRGTLSMARCIFVREVEFHERIFWKKFFDEREKVVRVWLSSLVF